MNQIHFRLILAFLLIFIEMPNFIECFSFRSRPKTLSIDRFSSCPNHEKDPVQYSGTTVQTGRNKVVLNGNITANEHLPRPIEVQSHISLQYIDHSCIHIQ